MIDVSYEVDEGAVTVVARDAAASTTATVRRTSDAEILAHVPVGTRSADALTMVVDDTPVDLRPGPGRFTRGSYTVTALHEGVTYRLAPASTLASQLMRDGMKLGTFTRYVDGEISVEWEPGVEVTANDTAVGYALAAAFTTGAQSTISFLIEAIMAVFP